MKATALPAIAAALALAATGAAADVRLHYTDAGGRTVSEVWVRDGQVLIERASENLSILVDTASGGMTMIDHGRRMYTRLDRDTRSRMQAQMQQMRAQMQQQLAALPEQQRKMIEQQMGGMMGGDLRGPEFRETGEQRTVAGHDCRVVEGSMGGRPLFSACVAPATSLGLPADDAATLEAMAKVMSESAAGMHGAGGQSPMAMQGVPLASTNPRTGVTETLAAVETGNVDAARFQVPGGYVEQKMGGPGMGGGMGMPQQ